MKTRRFIAGILALTLTGCTVGPNYKRPLRGSASPIPRNCPQFRGSIVEPGVCGNEVAIRFSG